MKYLFILGVIVILFATVSIGCKKNKDLIPTSVDSLEIHKAGGFSGEVNMHYMITPAYAKKGKYNNMSIVFDSVMSPAKHIGVCGLLQKLPQGMLSHDHSTPPVGADMVDHWVVSYKGGAKFTYYFPYNREEYLSFAEDMEEAFLVLSAQ